MTGKSKSVRDWEQRVAEFGCVVTGRPDIQLHHVLGRSYVQNKIPIGQVYILPLCFELHDVSSNHPLNVTHYWRRFVDAYGYQRDLFVEMCVEMMGRGLDLPFGNEVMEAIKSTHK